MAGLLIVNADDWGGGIKATDAAFEAFQAGGISSATAMMYMADSDRAAAIGREHDLPLGLHLNLTQPFESTATPPSVADAQARVTRAFESLPRRRFGVDPVTFRALRATLEDQLHAFRLAYGREPTHIDGHNHAHLNPMALAVLPQGAKVRTAHALVVSASPATEALRALRHAVIARWFRTTGAFYGLRRLHPALGGGGLDAVLEQARRTPVEIMTHPAHDDERELLLSAEWRERIAGRRLGSYADL